jgi:aryl sulfotransferase
MAFVRRYEGTVYDSNRWAGFELRPGDIIISSPPKCGTTWTQMICALLILQETQLLLPLDTLSPWIDMVTRARREVVGTCRPRRTAGSSSRPTTPLDGIPNDPTVTYICVGRDPRDVGLSMDRHIDNTDVGAFLQAREQAAAIDGIELGPVRHQPPRPEGVLDRFWQWVDDETPST